MLGLDLVPLEVIGNAPIDFSAEGQTLKFIKMVQPISMDIHN